MNSGSAHRLIEHLQRPELYPHAVESFDVIETHISWILLTGRFAYKIKKPVDFGFVDFSTLSRRKFYCQEEMRLNGRLAPHLYLGVTTITGTVQRPVLDGQGEPIEFAVRMRQFPQDSLLSRLLEADRLRPAHIDTLAAEVADFHDRIAVAGPGSPFATPERIRQPAEENFRQLMPVLHRRADRDRIRPLADWTRKEFHAREADFRARKRAGFVRECHGDMHVGNMILEGAESDTPDHRATRPVTIFDCIEFNEDFRWIDVMNEIAFCVMDLQDRGRSDFAFRFLNGYLELTGDYPGTAVMPFYLTYRAMVRAKVLALRLVQEGVDGETRRRLGAELQSYLALAERYTADPRPVLMITHGLSGSGKTVGTQRLLQRLGAVRIRSDVERKRLAGLPPNRRTGSGIDAGLYTPERTRQTYDRLADHAAAAVQAGYPTIVDATFLKREQRDRFRTLARAWNVPSLVLEFHAPEEVLRRRIAGRRQDRQEASEATEAVLQAQIRAREPLADDERESSFTIEVEKDGWIDGAITAVEKRRGR